MLRTGGADRREVRGVGRVPAKEGAYGVVIGLIPGAWERPRGLVVVVVVAGDGGSDRGGGKGETGEKKRQTV